MNIFKALGFTAAMLCALPAAAQTEAEFIAAFAGEWVTFEPTLSESGQCSLTLNQEQTDGRYGVATTNCAGPLAELGGWGIVDNQLALLDGDGEIQVRLGGNQTRMTGDTADTRAVIFERAGTETRAFDTAAISSGACLYLGYTATCAEPNDLVSPIQAGPELSQVSVLVDLNARGEARPDAGVVTIVPKNTCVAVDQCLEASDGRWCKAQIADGAAWIRQQAVRLGQWPVLTYRGGC